MDLWGICKKKKKASKTIIIAYLPQHRPVKITTMRTNHKLRVECPDSDVTQVSNIMQDQNDVNWHVDQSKTWINTTNGKLLRKRFGHSWGITYSVRWGLNKSENVFNLFIKINKRWSALFFVSAGSWPACVYSEHPGSFFGFFLVFVELASSIHQLAAWIHILSTWINFAMSLKFANPQLSTWVPLEVSIVLKLCVCVFKPHLAWITVYSGWLWILVFTKVFRWWTQKLKPKKKKKKQQRVHPRVLALTANLSDFW